MRVSEQNYETSLQARSQQPNYTDQRRCVPDNEILGVRYSSVENLRKLDEYLRVLAKVADKLGVALQLRGQLRRSLS